PFNVDGFNALEISFVVLDKFLAQQAISTRVFAIFEFSLLMAVINAKDAWPGWPWIVISTCLRRLRQQLKIDNTAGTMSGGGGNTVCAGVTATNHDHIFVLGGNVLPVFKTGIQKALCIGLEKLHGRINAVCITIGDG